MMDEIAKLFKSPIAWIVLLFVILFALPIALPFVLLMGGIGIVIAITSKKS